MVSDAKSPYYGPDSGLKSYKWYKEKRRLSPKTGRISVLFLCYIHSNLKYLNHQLILQKVSYTCSLLQGYHNKQICKKCLAIVLTRIPFVVGSKSGSEGVNVQGWAVWGSQPLTFTANSRCPASQANSDGPVSYADHPYECFEVFCAAAHPGGDAPTQDALDDAAVDVLEHL